MTAFKEQIWAYIHGELSKEEKARFEQALNADPTLRQDLEERQETDSLPKEVFKPISSNKEPD